MEKNAKDRSKILKQWRSFQKVLAVFEGDVSYNELIRGKGFEVKHMSFENETILFTILTNNEILIPYTILPGGYHSCMSFISDEINALEASLY